MDDPPSTTTKTTTTTTTTTFPQSRLLPPELRFTIWELCLPQRIIPLSILVLAHEQHTAATSTTTNKENHQASPEENRLIRSTLARPTLIAHITRESRAVALSLRRPAAQALGLPRLDAGGGGGGGWLDPCTDTFLVDCDVAGVYASLWARWRSELLLLAERRCRFRVGVRNGETGRCWAFFGGGVGEAGPGGIVRVPVVVLEVALYMTPAEACASGLFGLLGEGCGVFIDLRDEGQLERLFAVQGKRLWGRNLRSAVQRAGTRWRKCGKRVGRWPVATEAASQGPAGLEGTLSLPDRTWSAAPDVDLYPVVQVQWFDLDGRG
ncbi:hypothetical protein VTG60DRAFT_666 [Thermothelomyces hinnuleus]